MSAYYGLESRLYTVKCVLDSMEFVLGEGREEDPEVYRQHEALRTLLDHAQGEVEDANESGNQMLTDLRALQRQTDQK